MTAHYAFSGRKDHQINARLVRNDGDIIEGVVVGNVVRAPWPVTIMRPPLYVEHSPSHSFQLDHITENGWAVYFELTIKS